MTQPAPASPASLVDAARARPWTYVPRVVIAEDDADFASLLVDGIRDLGLDVVCAADGQALISLIEASARGTAEPIDMVITDIRMPGLDGLRAIERLRELDWAMPVVVMSAYLGLADADEALRLGATHVLPKPFAIEELQHLVFSAVGENRT